VDLRSDGQRPRCESTATRGAMAAAPQARHEARERQTPAPQSRLGSDVRVGTAEPALADARWRPWVEAEPAKKAVKQQRQQQ
jgi:hypothetical protein